MKCPRDDSTLLTITKSGLEVESCPTCSGLWCDANELARLAGTADDLPPTENLRLDGLKATCPVCEVGMNRRYYSQARHLLVDRCPQCRGIWLDEHELADIVKHAHDLGG
ncbi:zf-TFIIB domain-containing protein [bacterium]|nr:zf-TFIIB domain-containing protein [bacterium]